MRYIEEGLDKDGNQCWFILDDAELVDIYNTQHEAENNL